MHSFLQSLYAHLAWYFAGKFTMSFPLAFAAGALGSLGSYGWLDGCPCCRTALTKMFSMVFISQSGFIFACLIIVRIR